MLMLWPAHSIIVCSIAASGVRSPIVCHLCCRACVRLIIQPSHFSEQVPSTSHDGIISRWHCFVTMCCTLTLLLGFSDCYGQFWLCLQVHDNCNNVSCCHC